MCKTSVILLSASMQNNASLKAARSVKKFADPCSIQCTKDTYASRD